MAQGNFFDSSGRLQASINMMSMVCRRTGTGQTVTRQGGNTNPSSLLVDVSGCAYPLVAIKIDNYAAALAGKSGSSNHWVCSAPVGTAFTYYIYDYSTSLPNTKAPAKLWDESGRCTFNGDFFPMVATTMFTGVGQTALPTGAPMQPLKARWVVTVGAVTRSATIAAVLALTLTARV